MSSTLVSACLLGRPCRYDAHSKPSAAVAAWLEKRGGAVVAVCPEELGGLGTPRPAACLVDGDGHAVLAGRASVRLLQGRGADVGADVSAAFVDGAHVALSLAPGADTAVLKARSPSCGCGQTWIDGQLVAGDGVFAALLRQRGVTLRTDEDLQSRRGKLGRGTNVE